MGMGNCSLKLSLLEKIKKIFLTNFGIILAMFINNLEMQ